MDPNNTIYTNTQDPNTVSNPNPQTDTNNQPQQWIAIHNYNIIDFYGSQGDAVNGLNGYRMSNSIDINDTLGVYQII
jgi:hypothetical protein